MYGRPGPTYVELPVPPYALVTTLTSSSYVYLLPIHPQAEVIYDLMDESKLVLPRPVPPPPLTFADPKSVRAALELLKHAKNPLVIVGKVPIGLCPTLAPLLRAFGTHRVLYPPLPGHCLRSC